MNFFKHTPMIGVDISPCSLRLVRLMRTLDYYEIQQMLELPLPEKLFCYEKIIDFHYIQKQLLELVEKHDLCNSQAAVALPHSLVITSQLVLPLGLNETAIEQQIRTELRQHLPNFATDLSIDFHSSVCERVGYQKINFIGVRQLYLQQYLRCMQNARLRVRKVEMQAYALVRFLFDEIRDGSFIWLKQDVVHFIQFAQGYTQQYRYFTYEQAANLTVDYRSDVLAKIDIPEQFHVAAGLAMGAK